jgi:hypothetical protein
MNFVRQFTYIPLQNNVYLILITTTFEDIFGRPIRRNLLQLVLTIEEDLFAVRPIHLGNIPIQTFETEDFNSAYNPTNELD